MIINGATRNAFPAVERDDAGRLTVRADGRRYPAVEQFADGVARCPYGCEAETHVHGVDGQLVTHRASHCSEKPEDDVGYFLLRPFVGLLGAGFRWWESEPDPFDVRAASGPGLLVDLAGGAQPCGPEVA